MALVPVLRRAGHNRQVLQHLKSPAAVGGQQLDATRWGQLLDLSLEGTGERYALTASLVEIARWGHFTAPDHPWERISPDGTGGSQEDSPLLAMPRLVPWSISPSSGFST
ncbi:MAG: hypothetical protein ABSE84_07840 [Isosphaeraceae bacterium]